MVRQSVPVRSSFLTDQWNKIRGDATGSLLQKGPETRRPEWVSLLLLAIVVLSASSFAYAFRESARLIVDWYSGTEDITAAATSHVWTVRFGVVTGAIVVGSGLGRFAQNRWSGRLGLHAVAATARGDDRSISFRATVARSLGTWVANVGFVSIGRESAIVETGGAIGSSLGRRFGGRGAALAAGGIAAAFAAAYHAPIAALFYVEEHLRARTMRRTTAYTLLGAFGGYGFGIYVLGVKPIVPSAHGDRWTMLGSAALVVIPAAIAARLFLAVRNRATVAQVVGRYRTSPFVAIGAFAMVGGALVAAFPDIAGNGMEALRHASREPQVSLLVALCVWKLLGSAAALGSGNPGGVLTPTMSVAAGAAGLAMVGLHGLGLSTGPVWDAMLVAMTVGIAVGLRSPLVAVFLVAEMSGDLGLVPPMAFVVLLAVLVDHVINRVVRASRQNLPAIVRDEDA